MEFLAEKDNHAWKIIFLAREKEDLANGISRREIHVYS